MKELTQAEINQVSGGSENETDPLNFILGLAGFSAGIGIFAQAISHSFYDLKIPGTNSPYLLVSFFKAAVITGALGGMIGTMTFFMFKQNAEGDHSIACM